MNEAANPFQEKWIGVDGPIDTSTASAASKPVPIPGSGNGGSGGRGLAIDHVDTFLGAFSSAPTDSPVGSPTRPPPLSAQDLEEGAARAGVSLSDAAASSGLPSPIGTSSLRKVQKMFFILKNNSIFLSFILFSANSKRLTTRTGGRSYSTVYHLHVTVGWSVTPICESPSWGCVLLSKVR